MEFSLYILILSFFIHLRKNGIRRLFHWGPLVALFIIAFIATCTVKCHLAWWPPQSTWSYINLSAVLVFLNLILYNFYKASYLGPGFVEVGWEPKCPEDKMFLQYCNICMAYKAPRSHHCRKCQRCVMKMDHHCPWINNCVGHVNHANFFFFLFITPIGCMHALTILVPSTYRCFYRSFYIFYGNGAEPLVDLSTVWFISSMMAVGKAVGVVISVGGLFFMQLRTILRNETGIESWIKEKASYRKNEKGEGDFDYPYNLGRWKNFKMVVRFGGEWDEMDGVWWPVKSGCHQYTLTVEQIQQKNEKRTRSILFLIHRKFKGSMVPVTFGCGTYCCPPCIDEQRLKVIEGDRVLVTRFRKNWLYGEKLFLSEVHHMHSREKRERGWFPRKCATKSSEKFDSSAKQPQLDKNMNVDIDKLDAIADERFLNKKIL